MTVTVQRLRTVTGRQGPLLAWNSAHAPPASACLSPQAWDFKNMPPHSVVLVCLFLYGPWVSNSGPYMPITD